MLLCDFHIHTTMSDGKLSLREVIDFYGKNGFDVIGITDHLCESKSFLGKAAQYLDKTLTPERLPLYFKILEEEASRAWDLYKMLVLPGVEITKNDWGAQGSAHYLCYGYSGPMDADRGVEEGLSYLKSQGALLIAAHPVPTRKSEHQTFYLWNKRQELKELFDLWEVASGSYLFREVLEENLPKVASSDFHRPHQMSSWKTLVDSEKSAEAVFEALRNQNVKFHYFDRVAHPYTPSLHVGGADRRCWNLGSVGPRGIVRHGALGPLLPA